MNGMSRPDAVTDFGQFAGLRAEARANNPDALRKSAQQFEALLTQQMLKSMRAASLGDDVMGGEQTEFYRDMFDQQLSAHLASGRGLGIADLLVRQMQARGAGAATEGPAEASDANRMIPLPRAPTSSPALPDAVATAVPAPKPPRFWPALPIASLPAASAGPEVAAAVAARNSVAQAKALTSGIHAYQRFGAVAGSVEPAPVSAPIVPRTAATAIAGGTSRAVAVAEDAMPATARRMRSPAEFVAAVRPHAEAAAAELGVPARVLIAQAALETGWGRKAIRHDHGGSSFNLFGIKADRRWQGPDIERMTTEYQNGAAVREAASFRAYGSVGESFADYVNFLKSNPRYTDALRHGGDPRRFVDGLQQAGYATDPAYAQKILRVANGRTMTAALNVPRLQSV